MTGAPNDLSIPSRVCAKVFFCCRDEGVVGDEVYVEKEGRDVEVDNVVAGERSSEAQDLIKGGGGDFGVEGIDISVGGDDVNVSMMEERGDVGADESTRGSSVDEPIVGGAVVDVEIEIAVVDETESDISRDAITADFVAIGVDVTRSRGMSSFGGGTTGSIVDSFFTVLSSPFIFTLLLLLFLDRVN
jgi:hypothetical protein